MPIDKAFLTLSHFAPFSGYVLTLSEVQPLPQCGNGATPPEFNRAPVFDCLDEFAAKECSRSSEHFYVVDSSPKAAFEAYLYQDNKEGSGKASSYLKALHWLHEMLGVEAFGFEDALDLWSMTSVDRLFELRERVKREQKKGDSSPWVQEGISKSYLRDGYCSAALTQLIEFLPRYQHARKALDLLHAHDGEEAALVDRLARIDPVVPDVAVREPGSKDGKDRIREARTRIGQHAFREVILEIYRNRCCLTGLDLPAVNRASHIIGWAESPKTRMDPRNGLCLSATYDAAFDRKLITFDEDFRMVLSKTVREHVRSDSLREYFLSKAGTRIELPPRFRPLEEYLEVHRSSGEF